MHNAYITRSLAIEILLLEAKTTGEFLPLAGEGIGEWLLSTGAKIFRTVGTYHHPAPAPFLLGGYAADGSDIEEILEKVNTPKGYHGKRYASDGIDCSYYPDPASSCTTPDSCVDCS